MPVLAATRVTPYLRNAERISIHSIASGIVSGRATNLSRFRKSEVTPSHASRTVNMAPSEELSRAVDLTLSIPISNVNYFDAQGHPPNFRGQRPTGPELDVITVDGLGTATARTLKITPTLTTSFSVVRRDLAMKLSHDLERHSKSWKIT